MDSSSLVPQVLCTEVDSQISVVLWVLILLVSENYTPKCGALTAWVLWTKKAVQHPRLWAFVHSCLLPLCLPKAKGGVSHKSSLLRAQKEVWSLVEEITVLKYRLSGLPSTLTPERISSCISDRFYSVFTWMPPVMESSLPLVRNFGYLIISTLLAFSFSPSSLGFWF